MQEFWNRSPGHLWAVVANGLRLRILRDNHLRGEELIGFGDGFVEIEEIKRVGGVAIAVASDEANRRGIHAWKRDRLVRAGADVVIGDYRCREALLGLLFAD